MFDAKQTNDYRQTTVPAEWKEEILLAADNAHKRTKRHTVKHILSLAACLVLIVLGGILVNAFTTSPAVTTTVTQPSSVAMARADIALHARITLTADGHIRVSTEDPSLRWVNENGDAVPFTEKTANDVVILEWTVSTEQAVFTANGQTYTVTYDPQRGEVTVSPIVPD